MNPDYNDNRRYRDSRDGFFGSRQPHEAQPDSGFSREQFDGHNRYSQRSGVSSPTPTPASRFFRRDGDVNDRSNLPPSSEENKSDWYRPNTTTTFENTKFRTRGFDDDGASFRSAAGNRDNYRSQNRFEDVQRPGGSRFVSGASNFRDNCLPGSFQSMNFNSSDRNHSSGGFAVLENQRNGEVRATASSGISTIDTRNGSGNQLPYRGVEDNRISGFFRNTNLDSTDKNHSSGGFAVQENQRNGEVGATASSAILTTDAKNGRGNQMSYRGVEDNRLSGSFRNMNLDSTDRNRSSGGFAVQENQKNGEEGATANSGILTTGTRNGRGNQLSYRGVVTKVTDSVAYIWPVQSNATEELCVDERELPLADRLKSSEWVEYELKGAVINTYRKIETEITTFLVEGIVWVMDDISNVRIAVTVNPKRCHYVGNSELFGRVGIFFCVEKLAQNKTYTVWITRNIKHEHDIELFAVHWCAVKSAAIAEKKDDRKESGPAPQEREVTPAIQKLEQAPPSSIQFNVESGGLIVSRKDHLGFVWSSDFNEGLILECLFEVGDWISFTTAPIKSTGTSTYTARNVVKVSARYPTKKTERSVQVLVPAIICRCGSKWNVFAEWFGEITVDRYFANLQKITGKSRAGIVIERRRRSENTTSSWSLVEIRELLDDRVERPLFGTDNFCDRMLRYFFESDEFRELAHKHDKALALSVEKYFGIPPW